MRKEHRKINIKDLSRKLGVSVATASRALSGKGRVSAETREKIRRKADELGYRANIHARNLILRRSENIAFFYTNIEKGKPDYFMSEVMLGANDATAKRNMHLLVNPISNSDDQPMEFYTDFLLNGTIAGAIVVTANKASDNLLEIAAGGNIPSIAIGDTKMDGVHKVTFQLEKGGMLAGDYFRKSGRGNPAYVGGFMDGLKKKGFRKGLGQLGAKLFQDLGGASFEDGKDSFGRIIAAAPKTDCVLCANDVLAMGFIKGAALAGFNVPGDIAVIGFDDIQAAAYHSPALTTIRLHNYQIGETAANVLLDLIEGRSTRTETVIGPVLIGRESA